MLRAFSRRIRGILRLGRHSFFGGHKVERLSPRFMTQCPSLHDANSTLVGPLTGGIQWEVEWEDTVITAKHYNPFYWKPRKISIWDRAVCRTLILRDGSRVILHFQEASPAGFDSGAAFEMTPLLDPLVEGLRFLLGPDEICQLRLYLIANLVVALNPDYRLWFNEMVDLEARAYLKPSEAEAFARIVGDGMWKELDLFGEAGPRSQRCLAQCIHGHVVRERAWREKALIPLVKTSSL